MDLIGQKFGRLFVKKKIPTPLVRKGRIWLCKCDCGNEHTTTSSGLKLGRVKSCGCLRKEVTRAMRTTHGARLNGRSPRFYNIWKGIRQRCSNPKSSVFGWYGNRGIIICERWNSFVNFKKDMYPSYFRHIVKYGRKNTTLDRINPNGPYSPENCRWATYVVQRNNARPQNNQREFIAVRIMDGYTERNFSQNSFAKKHGLCQGAISNCLYGKIKSFQGWTFEWVER